MAKTEVPWTEAFLAMLSLIVVLIFILIYYCILPCVKYYKHRKEEEEAWWQYDPRWNKDTFRGAVTHYDQLSSSLHSSHSTSPINSFRGISSNQSTSNLPEIVSRPKDKIQAGQGSSSKATLKPPIPPKKKKVLHNIQETQDSIINKSNKI